MKYVGSLVLGTGSAASSEISEFERNKYDKIWQIKIDKKPRFIADCNEADGMLNKAMDMDYDTMFLKASDKAAFEERKKQDDEVGSPKAKKE
jgi:hypothetical protein